MARPNVQFKIIDESFVIPPAEAFSSTIGAVFNPTRSFENLGLTTDKEVGYMFIPNISSLFSKVTDFIIRGANGITFFDGVTAYSVGSCAASLINGTFSPTGFVGSTTAFVREFWPIHNFLQYGSGCYVGFHTATIVSPSSAFMELGYDVIFQGGGHGGTGACGASAAVYSAPVITIVENRLSNDLPVIGVVNVISGTNDISAQITTWASSPPAGIGPPSGTNTTNYIRVYGEKLQINSVGGSSETELIRTSLAADVAGCLCRTDREAFPWFSPAGAKRGRILNSVRLSRALSNADQDLLYNQQINPVVTFPGDGTLLFGDKTGAPDTSTLSRINVSRLFIYIKKALAPIARSVLFEQNDATTRLRFKSVAAAFMERIRAQRGVSEFKIICDSSNNTPDLVSANYFVADILIKPTTSVNYVKITLTNKDLSDIL